MKFVIQRVSRASVEVGGKITGQIGPGLMILAGFNKADSPENIPRMIDKTVNLRVFEDQNEKMNLSLLDIKGELLVISQSSLFVITSIFCQLPCR